MGEIYAGGTLERMPSPKLANSLRFFEYAPKPPLSTLATLARIGKQLNDKTGLSLVCPKSSWLTPNGAMRKGPALDAGIDWITRVSDILRARAIVIATGAELSTGERDRTLLAEFVERLRPTGRILVVAPRGLWEPEHGAAFAKQTNTVYGFDPLESDAPEGDIVYARIRPMGARPRLTEGHLAQVAERLLRAGAEQAFVTIESDQPLRDAKRLLKLLAEVQSADFDAGPEDEEDEEEADEEGDEEGEAAASDEEEGAEEDDAEDDDDEDGVDEDDEPSDD
jgi:hypothetical protein